MSVSAGLETLSSKIGWKKSVCINSLLFSSWGLPTSQSVLNFHWVWNWPPLFYPCDSLESLLHLEHVRLSTQQQSGIRTRSDQHNWKALLQLSSYLLDAKALKHSPLQWSECSCQSVWQLRSVWQLHFTMRIDAHALKLMFVCGVHMARPRTSLSLDRSSGTSFDVMFMC